MTSEVVDGPPEPAEPAPGPTRASRAVAWVRANPALSTIVVVALGLRVGWVVWTDAAAPTVWQISGDQYSYYHHGLEIAAGRGYHSYVSTGPTAYYPIGYPAILAGLFWVVGHTPLPDDYLTAANLLNVAVGTASVVFTYRIGRRLFGRLAGLVAAGIVAVLPNLVFQAATIQLETMVIFWYLLAIVILVDHDWQAGAPSTRRLVVFGAVLGVSVLVRPFSVWFLVALLVAALVAGLGWRRSLRTAAIPLAMVVLISLPWVIRNAVVMDAFIPSSTNTGDTLCLDRFEGANGRFRFADHDGCADPALSEVPRNQESTRMAISWVLDHPRRELQQIWRRAALIYGSDHDGVEVVNQLGGGPVMSAATQRTWSRIADDAFSVVLVLAAAGLVVLLADRRLRNRPVVPFVLISVASLVAVPLLLWGNPRFHLPVSPFLAVFAGGAVGALAGLVGGRRSASQRGLAPDAPASRGGRRSETSASGQVLRSGRP